MRTIFLLLCFTSVSVADVLDPVDARGIRDIGSEKILLNFMAVKEIDRTAIEFNVTGIYDSSFSSAQLVLPIRNIDGGGSVVGKVQLSNYSGDGAVGIDDWGHDDHFATIVDDDSISIQIIDVTDLLERHVTTRDPYVGFHLSPLSTDRFDLGKIGGMPDPYLMLDPKVVDLAGGWSAIVPEDIDRFEIVDAGLEGDAQHLRMSISYSDSPIDRMFGEVPIIFEQSADEAANFLVIDELTVHNGTSIPITDIDLVMSRTNGMPRSYDEDRTLASGTGLIGFDVDPFETAEFKLAPSGRSLLELDLRDGEIPANSDWIAGAGLDGGALWIDARPGSDGVLRAFTLTAVAMPEPSTLHFLVTAGLMMPGIRSRRTSR